MENYAHSSDKTDPYWVEYDHNVFEDYHGIQLYMVLIQVLASGKIPKAVDIKGFIGHMMKILNMKALLSIMTQ